MAQIQNSAVPQLSICFSTRLLMWKPRSRMHGFLVPILLYLLLAWLFWYRGNFITHLFFNLWEWTSMNVLQCTEAFRKLKTSSFCGSCRFLPNNHLKATTAEEEKPVLVFAFYEIEFSSSPVQSLFSLNWNERERERESSCQKLDLSENK